MIRILKYTVVIQTSSMFRSIGRNTKEAIAPLAELASCIERIEILISRVLIPKNRVGRRSSPPRTRQISGQGPYDDYPIVDFVLMASIKEEDELIELLRRIAELVVLGEQRAAQLLHNTDEPKDVEEREALALLEFFYERNTLDLIVGIITGDVFREMIAKKDSSSSLSSLATTTAPIATTPEYIYLPPIAVAIQAVQTISILLQNVVRATSLYLLLSNNRLGSLIQLSLELYHHAIQKKIPDRSTPNTKEIQQEQYAELSELTTHFISLLKSIALRINAETLQFFLVYPYTEKKRQVSKDEDTSPSPLPPIIEFPLYAKSLSFCSSQYDSFVRITALNICMNLIRASSLEDSSSVITSALPSATTSLTTITPSEARLENQLNVSIPITLNDKVPNAATLCNLPAISLQDRLGIMKYICTPTRVEALVSSIFLNVATICTSLEENIQALYVVDERLENLDDSRESTPQEGSNPNFESSFKERGECVRTIRNSAADLEDELYLLNDMLKLGLLGLNEQIVERILTTMIYPQLLQPLHSWLQYYHETPRKSMTITPPFGSDQENIMLSQATTALYVATILFRTVTHKPTLHVIFTALCHPLTPHESKSYIVSRSFSPKEFISYENESMSSYDFRHDVFVDRPPVQDESLAGELSEQQAVFILSPALFALFQSAMSDTNTEWIETKLNPYRSALLSSLSLSKKFPLLSKVAAYLLDSILASLSPAVVNNILQLHDEKESNSNDGIFHELMSSLYSNLITESISPSGKSSVFESSAVLLVFTSQQLGILLRTSSVFLGFATVDFDLIIAHVILCASILNDRSLEASERLVSLEFSKSISFLSHLPQFITEKLLSGNHSKPKDNHPSNQRYGTIVYNLFYGLSNGQFKCVVESLNRLNDTKDSAFIPIANDNSSGDLSSVFADESRFKAIHEHRNVYVDSVDSVLAILKVGMFECVFLILFCI